MTVPAGALHVAEWTAQFPLVKYAEEFAARISEPGWWAVDVKQKGRTVTFTHYVPESAAASLYGSDGFADMLQTVGYYGSTQSRKATLNGVRAPMQY